MVEEATLEMCVYCFDVLLHHFEGGPESQEPVLSSPGAEQLVCPLFVTWNKDGNLRGCIGTLSRTPLVPGLKDYALISSLSDRRFSPIERVEVPSLSVTVSLLTSYEEGEHPYDWVVGKHGIIIKFSEGGKGGDRYSATYLPEVAHEQGWTQKEAVASLVRKAGYRGALTQRLLDGMKLTRYQSSLKTITYHDYLAVKKEG